MSILDMNNESLKIFHISENEMFCNTINDNFDSFKSSNSTEIYNSINCNLKKKPSLMELEKKVYEYFMDLYYQDKYFYSIKVITDIINNSETHVVAEFKDFLIMGDESEFLQRKYNMKESKKYLPILFDYYKSSSIIFPNYFLLYENKYIFKNIRKKQKIIDKLQEQNEKKEKIKKGEIILDDNADFFTTKIMNSILSQTNSSYMRFFFGINRSKDKNDSQDIVNNILKKIVEIEHKVLLENKKNYFFKKHIQKSIKDGKNIEYNTNINNNTINSKVSKGKKENNIHKNKSNNNIKILNTNRNIIIPKRIFKNLKTNIHHEKSNTCILESDINKFLPKKALYLDINKSKINKNNKSKRQIISKIISKIKKVNSSIFQKKNSFNKVNKKRFMINMRKFQRSISPIMNKSKRKIINFELIKKISESNSTPNIYNLNINKNIKKEKKFIKRENKLGKEKELKLTKTNSNLVISPIKKLLTKNDSNLLEKNHKENINNIRSLKNNILRKSFKIKMKKNKNESKKVYLNTYKITPNIINHKYNSNISKILLSKEEMTISKKALTEQKFESIKVVKKHRTINSKKMKKPDIKNNININININSNNIYNNTNDLNYSNNKSIQNSSRINTNNNSYLNKSKYYDLLRKSSSFILKYPLIKKILLSSASNNNLYNNSKNNKFILEEINKKKNSVLNTKNNTLAFSGCITSRNSHNSSTLKNISKKNNKIGNLTNFSSNKIKIKEDFVNKKEAIIHHKNKIPLIKSPKTIKRKCKAIKK